MRPTYTSKDVPKPPLDPSTYGNITEWKEDSIENSFSGNHIEKKEVNVTEGAFSAARRKISSSSFSPCQKYLQRKGTQEEKKKKKREAKRNDEQSAKVRRKKRHISPYVVRGLGRSRWMSRSEPDLYSVLRWDCKIIHCYVRLSEQGLHLSLR